MLRLIVPLAFWLFFIESVKFEKQIDKEKLIKLISKENKLSLLKEKNKLLTTSTSTSSSSSSSSSLSSSNYIFPCYYYYESQNLKPESIPAIDLCTHIIIIGCINEQVNETIVKYQTRPFNCSIVLAKLVGLKKKNPNLKLIISMANNGEAMHSIVQNEKSILNYTHSALRLVDEYNYDGINFEWEFPCGSDKLKYIKLIEKFRDLIQILNLNLTLSASIGAGFNTIKECFDLDGLVKNLDYINVMCYDYNSIYNSYTAYASPLFARPEETGYDVTLNTNFTINYLIQNKVPPSKIVVGFNTGGHTYQLADPANKHDFHAPILGVGFGNGWSQYPQLCKIIRTKNGVGVYDVASEVLYAYYDDQWTNTGDVRSAIARAKWAKSMNLAGIFTWCLNWDDLFNICGHNVTFPIHRAIRKQLFSD